MSKSATNAEEYVEVAKANEIANSQMKHVQVKGKEILIANIDRKFYALNDRCGHMNALLSTRIVSGLGVH
jgi:nitrite reductase/ring-hydroxylating ferredoxin subunit